MHTEDQAESLVRGSEDVLDGGLKKRFAAFSEVDSEFHDTDAELARKKTKKPAKGVLLQRFWVVGSMNSSDIFGS